MFSAQREKRQFALRKMCGMYLCWYQLSVRTSEKLDQIEMMRDEVLGQLGQLKTNTCLGPEVTHQGFLRTQM